MKVLIDNGHGENTPGKRSPDGRLREWAYSREIADRVVSELRKKGIDAERIVKEDTDVPLFERCQRANAIYKETGKKAILVSIHCNAAGSGANWMNAKGWSVFVSNNASRMIHTPTSTSSRIIYISPYTGYKEYSVTSS